MIMINNDFYLNRASWSRDCGQEVGDLAQAGGVFALGAGRGKKLAANLPRLKQLLGQQEKEGVVKATLKWCVQPIFFHTIAQGIAG